MHLSLEMILELCGLEAAELDAERLAILFFQRDLMMPQEKAGTIGLEGT